MKIIHYCWFGGEPHPPLMQACITSWKKHCPDYEIKEWNESNFNIQLPFLQRAIDDKKWAFIADYVRLKVLHEYGGVYLDTDMELIKPFDQFLHHEFVLGYESEGRVNFGAIVMKKGSFLGKQVLDYWIKDFSNREGYLAIPAVLSAFVADLQQQYPDLLTLLPERYFYPYNPYDQSQAVKQLLYSHITKDTVAIHHWMNSWSEPKKQLEPINTYRKFSFKIFLQFVLPSPLYDFLKSSRDFIKGEDFSKPAIKALPSKLEKKKSDITYFRKHFKQAVLNEGILFVHVPKAAGTSVVSSLYNKSDWTHLTYQDYIDEYGSEVVDKLKTFALVRDPYDRLLSAFNYLKRSDLYFDKEWVSQHLTMKSFEDFVLSWLTSENVENCLIDHFKLQSYFVREHKGLPSFRIWKIEELPAKQCEIEAYLGRKMDLPKKNKGVDFHDMPVWTKAMVERVSQVYAQDLSQFNYPVRTL